MNGLSSVTAHALAKQEPVRAEASAASAPQPGKLAYDISARIAILRFVMVFGILVLHTPTYVEIADVQSDPFNLFKALMQHAVFRCTVPVLTAISGFLLFRSGLDRFPRELYRKKFQALVVPFLIFNTMLAVIALLIQRQYHLPISYQLVPFDALTFADAAFGLRTMPINYPLYFLRDLIVVCALAPVLGWLLRRTPYWGLALVAAFFVANLEGSLVLRGVTPVSFYLGGMCAVGALDVRRLDKYALPCLLAFLGACVFLIAFRISNTTYLRVVAPLMIWPAASLLLDTRFGRWAAGMSRYSFFMFLAHAPALIISWFLYQLVSDVVPYPVYWMLAPVLLTAALIGVYKLAMRYAPRAFTFINGNRG